MSGLTVFIIILAGSLAASTLLYLYLIHKTRIRSRYLIIDNLVVALAAALTSCVIYRLLPGFLWPLLLLIIPAIVVLLSFSLTMIRFWRTPRRAVRATPGQVVSPADGKVIYIRRIDAGEPPVAIKGNIHSRLEEITRAPLLEGAGWHIGINMTPFDVHKNCSPISGKVILSRHFNGRFLSLKNKAAVAENERNTWVFQNDSLMIGVVQIASRLVRRIETYVPEGESVRQGDWIGMIRFGSQVDVILPASCRILVHTGEQIYAASTIIAEQD